MNRKHSILFSGIFPSIILVGMIIFVVGGFAIYESQQLADLADKIHDHPLAVSNAVRKIQANINAMHRSMKDVVIANTPEELKDAIEQVDADEVESFKAFDLISERFLGDQKYVESARQDFKNWKAIRDSVIALKRQGRQNEAAKITKTKGPRHIELMNAGQDGKSGLNYLLQFAENKADEFRILSEERKQKTTIGIFVVFVLCIILAMIAVILFRHNMRANAELQQSEERYSYVIEATKDGLWDWSISTDKVYVNPGYYTMLGFEPNEFTPTGQTWINLLHPDDRERVLRVNNDCIENKTKNFEVEYRLKTKSGSWKWVLGRGTAVNRDQNGRALRMVGTHVDITDRKQAEEALQETEGRLRAALHAADMGTWHWDAVNNLDTRDASFNRILGLEAAESTQPVEDFLQRVHPEDRSSVNQEIKRSIRERDMYRAEFRIVRPNGTERWLRDQGMPFYDEQENISYMTGAVVDTTERKKIEETLSLERKRLFTLMDSLPAYVYLQSPDHRIHFANRYFRECFGESEGRLCYEVIWGATKPCSPCPTFKVFDSKAPQVWEWPESLDGRSYQAYDYPFIDIDGTFLVLELGIDITERKQMEEQLKKSLAEKDILLKEIHHRVKNNLQVVSSIIELQSKGAKDIQIFKECQRRIKSMALIHELLYQSEDMSGINFFNYTKHLVDTIYRTYGSDKTRITTVQKIDAVMLGLDIAVPCGLIINELVSNALKHAFPRGRKGEITVALQSVNEDEIEFMVSDNGIGIPENVDIRNTNSLGLKLATIVAEHQLGAHIQLDRTGGTSFKIRFNKNQ